MTEDELHDRLTGFGYSWTTNLGTVVYRIRYFTSPQPLEPYIIEENTDGIHFYTLSGNYEEQIVSLEEAYAQLYKSYVTYKLNT
jgi:hypothetical protein